MILNKCSRDAATGASSACSVHEELDDSWFEEQMGDEGLVSEEKAKKPR